jgi:hypothetical protein
MKQLVVLLAWWGRLPLQPWERETYQVTGPVLAVTADSIVVQKVAKSGKSGDSSTKVTGGVEKSQGDHEYRMTAATGPQEEKAAAEKKK